MQLKESVDRLGLVTSKNANLFEVEYQGEIFSFKPSGKTKAGGIFVGDYVEFGENITKVAKRKNLLIRPSVANIDKMFIVIAPSPKPDFVLVDKLLVYCHLNDITPILVVNKCDLCDDNFKQIVNNSYQKHYKTMFLSAKSGKIEGLEQEISGICVLAGQSAVGKSSLINAIFKKENLAEVGNLSAKVERGKQTTRLIRLYKVGKGYLADTAGFSLLDLSIVGNVDYTELASYYPDFLQGRAKCKYRSCTHEGGDCGVIDQVKKGKITQKRYENYLKILEELKNKKKF